MGKLRYMFTFLTIALTSHAIAQTTPDRLIGKWITEDKTVVEFLRGVNSYSIKQIAAVKDSDKKFDGKQIGKGLVASGDNDYTGIVIDPSDDKEYKATWTLAADGKSIRLKVKWGFLGFNESWTKQ